MDYEFVYAFTDTKYVNYPAYINISKRKDKYVVVVRAVEEGYGSEIALSRQELINMQKAINDYLK